MYHVYMHERCFCSLLLLLLLQQQPMSTVPAPPAQEAHRQHSQQSDGTRASGVAAAAARLLHAPARLLRGSTDSQVCIASAADKGCCDACSVPTSA
jgi:hypothetical protein